MEGKPGKKDKMHTLRKGIWIFEVGICAYVAYVRTNVESIRIMDTGRNILN